MENKEATRTCGQCHKEIAEVNFALHESHCSRFLCLCPDCNEAVPRDQLEEHREEQHAEVRCSKCNKKMERCQLQDHDADDCVERLQKCQFCDLEVPFKDLSEHCLVCGSRTERCKDCGRYVRLRDQPEHGLTCSDTDNITSPPQATSSTFNGTEISVKCRKCTGSFPADEIDDHELECTRLNTDFYDDDTSEDEDDYSTQAAAPQLISTDEVFSFSSRPSRDPWIDGGDPLQISTCPYCYLTLPFSTLQWHTVKCRRNKLLK